MHAEALADIFRRLRSMEAVGGSSATIKALAAAEVFAEWLGSRDLPNPRGGMMVGERLREYASMVSDSWRGRAFSPEAKLLTEALAGTTAKLGELLGRWRRESRAVFSKGNSGYRG